MPPAPPPLDFLNFLRVAKACRACGAPLDRAARAFVLCERCGPAGGEYDAAPPADARLAVEFLARRRWDVYAVVPAAAHAAGWTLYRHQRSARSLSLYLEYARGPANYLKVRVSDHDRRPKPGGAGFAADWADLSAEFLFDPAADGPAAFASLEEARGDAARVFGARAA